MRTCSVSNRSCDTLASRQIVAAGGGGGGGGSGYGGLSFGGEGERTVIDGPFAETKELIAGFWLLQVRSFDEAVEWMKRCPNPHDEPGAIEIRQVFEAEDFGEEFTPELREQEERLRAQGLSQGCYEAAEGSAPAP